MAVEDYPFRVERMGRRGTKVKASLESPRAEGAVGQFPNFSNASGARSNAARELHYAGGTRLRDTPIGGTGCPSLFGALRRRTPRRAVLSFTGRSRQSLITTISRVIFLRSSLRLGW